MSISTPQRRADAPKITRPPTSRLPDTDPLPQRKERSGWWRWIGLLAVVGIVGGGGYLYVKNRGGLNTDQMLVLHEVKRGELNISVVERGTLESQDNVQVLCEVDEVRGDGIDGTPIIWLIKNGSSVKKGDLLVELASSSHQEQYDLQVLDTERARAELIQAQAKHENQITQNETTSANAELQVRLSELELEMFTDEESGTHKLEVEEIERLIDDINNEILAAQANLKLKKNEKQGMETLFKLGYAGKSELDAARLDFMQAESQYAAKMNKMSTQKSTLEKKKTFERQKQLLTLQGDVETAKRNLSQVELDNQALLAQAKAALDGAERAFAKEEERLARYKEELDKCQIRAPQDGMVVYASGGGRRWWMEEIREGGAVRPRQHILSLPDLSKMQVVTAVHESILDEIESGLPAAVRVEAFPDRVYKGTVKTVAVMAEQQSADTKVYKTVVTIDDQVSGLKPGMTAVVDIHVDRIRNVLTVPVQAVVQIGRDTWCYVQEDNGDVRQRVVELGRTNDKFVEVRDGLVEGDQVVLNPMALVGETKSVDERSEENATNPDEEMPPEMLDERLPPPGPGEGRSGDSEGASDAGGADRIGGAARGPQDARPEAARDFRGGQEDGLRGDSNGRGGRGPAGAGRGGARGSDAFEAGSGGGRAGRGAAGGDRRPGGSFGRNPRASDPRPTDGAASGASGATGTAADADPERASAD